MILRFSTCDYNLNEAHVHYNLSAMLLVFKLERLSASPSSDYWAPPSEFLKQYVLGGPKNSHFQQVPCDGDVVRQGPHLDNHWAEQIYYHHEFL